KQEIQQLLNGIEDGSKRTAEIVKGLRVFSRMDRNELVLADMVKLLDHIEFVTRNVKFVIVRIAPVRVALDAVFK
ncbi:MAG: hypothetical protein RLZZ449_387, partial [Actinomycetota bacterium]